MEAAPPPAPQEGREEGPNERTEEDVNKAVVATARSDNKGRKYKYMLAAVVVFAIAAGVVTRLLVSVNSNTP
jgi:hypothetical protein